MEYRSLGRTGLKVSIAGLGCNNFGGRLDAERSAEVILAAFDAGVTLFDTARMYSGGRSEEIVGRALESHRSEVVIATKFGAERDPSEPGGSRRHIIRSVETSLRALGTDYIDLFQLHYPDRSTPIEETLRTLDDLVGAGKVRYLGCSNVSGWMIADAAWTARTRGLEPFASVQNEWSLLARDIERDVVGACEHFGCSVLPYFPLASGLLTGKVPPGQSPPEGSRLHLSVFQSSLTEANLERVVRLDQWAVERGRTVTELALSWLASHDVVASVIAGASSPEQVRENVASTKTDLTSLEVEEIGGI